MMRTLDDAGCKSASSYNSSKCYSFAVLIGSASSHRLFKRSRVKNCFRDHRVSLTCLLTFRGGMVHFICFIMHCLLQENTVNVVRLPVNTHRQVRYSIDVQKCLILNMKFKLGMGLGL